MTIDERLLVVRDALSQDRRLDWDECDSTRRHVAAIRVEVEEKDAIIATLQQACEGYEARLMGGIDGAPECVEHGCMLSSDANGRIAEIRSEVAKRDRRIAELECLINTPETDDFDVALPREAAHQVERWGTAHDSGKTPPDWFWLIGYLAGKALASHIAGDLDKAKHHCISSAAALRNWHAHIRSGASTLGPGMDPPA